VKEVPILASDLLQLLREAAPGEFDALEDAMAVENEARPQRTKTERFHKTGRTRKAPQQAQVKQLQHRLRQPDFRPPTEGARRALSEAAPTEWTAIVETGRVYVRLGKMFTEEGEKLLEVTGQGRAETQ